MRLIVKTSAVDSSPSLNTVHSHDAFVLQPEFDAPRMVELISCRGPIFCRGCGGFKPLTRPLHVPRADGFHCRVPPSPINLLLHGEVARFHRFGSLCSTPLTDPLHEGSETDSVSKLHLAVQSTPQGQKAEDSQDHPEQSRNTGAKPQIVELIESRLGWARGVIEHGDSVSD